MQVTSEMVSVFVGLQVRIHDLRDNSSIQGELESAVIEYDWLTLRFKWTACKADSRIEWLKYEVLTFVRNMKGHAPMRVGAPNAEYKLSFCLQDTCESITFLPRKHLTNLDRKKVLDPSPSFVTLEG